MAAPQSPAGGATTQSPKPASISAIVPVWNGATTLGQCLAPLLTMLGNGEIAEVIVVDDGSTDGSAALAQRCGVRVMPSGGRLGPGGARNIGARDANGDILWFVDADVVVHDDAARVLREVLSTSGAAAVFGAYDEHPPAPNFLSQYKNLVHHYTHVRHPGASETFWAGCGAVTKRAFAAVGGFDAAAYPKPSIEDIELGARLSRRGFVIWLAPALAATHLKVWRLANLLRTDIFGRALPWSRLIRAHGAPPDTLNVSRAERARALVALAFAASVVLAALRFVPPWLPLAAIAAMFAVNAELFGFFRRRRGWLFAVGALLFHQLYYLYATAAYGWSWIERRVPAFLLRRKAVP